MSNTKRCSGYKGHWECSENYPDHEVPRSEFTPHSGQPDGLQDKCWKCKQYYNGTRPRHPETEELKVSWVRTRAVRYYGASEPKAKRANPIGPLSIPWRECLAMANKDAESIAWVRQNDKQPDNILQFTPRTWTNRNGEIKTANSVTLKPKEDFGPRTPMTKREPAKVIGKKVPEGWVYIVRNPEVPQYLKVGKTFPNGIGDIMSAARRYGRAELVHKEWASHAEVAEKSIAHECLKSYNLRALGYTDVGTEVFKVDEQTAIDIVKIACDLVNDPDWDGIVDVGDADDA